MICVFRILRSLRPGSPSPGGGSDLVVDVAQWAVGLDRLGEAWEGKDRTLFVASAWERGRWEWKPCRFLDLDCWCRRCGADGVVPTELDTRL